MTNGRNDTFREPKPEEICIEEDNQIKREFFSFRIFTAEFIKSKYISNQAINQITLIFPDTGFTPDYFFVMFLEQLIAYI